VTICQPFHESKVEIIGEITVRVVGLEDFPDWVDLIAFGALLAQGGLWQDYGFGDGTLRVLKGSDGLFR
jgi:hypothetical protein